MKKVPMAGLVVGVIALLLVLVALVSRPEGADDVRAELPALKKDLSGLKGQVAKASSGSGEVSAQVQELRAELRKLSVRTVRLERALAAAAERPAPGAAVQAGLGEERVREILREEMQAQMARFAGGRGAPGGGGRQDTPTALRETVGLDEKKAEQVAQIYQKMSEDVRNIWRENRGGDRDKNVELMRELQKKTEGEIAKLLTAEEMEKYRQWQQSRSRRGRRGGRDRGGRREEPAPRAQPAGEGVF